MQLIPSRTLKKAGPSISGLDISAPLELTQDVKPQTQVVSIKKSNNNTAFPPTETSCKPATLSTSTTTTTTTPLQSQNRLLHSLPRTDDHHLSSMLVTAIQSEIDGFLHDVQDHGFVLPAHESSIDRRLHELELYEHVLSPIAETRDCPGGCNPLTLTYSLPRANYGTKPRGGFLEDDGCVGVVVGGVGGVVDVSEKRAPRPSHAWARLGSRKYYFVGDDRGL